MKVSQQKKNELAKVIAENKALTATLTGAKLDFTAEEQATFTVNMSRSQKIKEQIAVFEAQEALEAEADIITPAVVKPTAPGANGNTAVERVKASLKRFGSLRNAKTAESAYRFGVFAAAVAGNQWAQRQVAKPELFGSDWRTNALQSEGVNTDGGYNVPEEFDPEMIDLREKFGVFRRECRIVPMIRDTKTVGRRVSGLTAFPAAEGVAGTVSTMKMDRVKLTAQKWLILATITKELNEDSAVNEGDRAMGEIAYGFAVTEDNSGFNGDGTGTFSGILGLKNALGASCKVTQGTSNTWATQVLSDINNLMSKLPDFTQVMNPAFYCNKAYYDQVLSRLAMAAGGVTSYEIVNGIVQGRFFGFPVHFVSSMPRASVTTGICLYFGDLGAAAKFGDRRQTRIEMSDSATVGGVSMFETDEIAIKGSERFDIVVHERGTSTAADAGGPMNALITG
jgi:HK97 family phage major capsid protein